MFWNFPPFLGPMLHSFKKKRTVLKVAFVALKPLPQFCLLFVGVPVPISQLWPPRPSSFFLLN